MAGDAVRAGGRLVVHDQPQGVQVRERGPAAGQLRARDCMGSPGLQDSQFRAMILHVP
jgi:hypothetical protein